MASLNNTSAMLSGQSRLKLFTPTHLSIFPSTMRAEFLWKHPVKQQLH